jgi:hypothetical protein
MVSALGNGVCSSLVAGARVVTANLFSRLRVIASNSGLRKFWVKGPYTF